MHRRCRLVRLTGVLCAAVFFSAGEPLAETVSHGFAVDGFVDVDGGRIYYEMTGAGTPLLFIHDGILHRETWDEQFAEFGRSYRVVRWDRRGYGRSSTPRAPFSHINDLHAVMKSLNIERSVLIGCSAGGMLALHFALDHPTMVSALEYGLSWQIVPTAMNEMLEKGTPEPLARVTQAFMKMKKFDIAELQKAFDGGSRVEVAPM